VFVVVRDDERRAKLGALARSLWDRGGRAYASAHVDSHTLSAIDESMALNFGGAPVLIVVGADLGGGVHPSTVAASVFPAVQNLLLAAAALGYGSALTTITTVMTEELRAIVELPDTIEALAVIPLGRPARPLGPPRRQPAASKTHRERFGTAW